jgi:hypothetical protein
LPTCHFANLTFCHFNILPNDILPISFSLSCLFPTCNLINLPFIYLPFHQLAISSTCNFINLPLTLAEGEGSVQLTSSFVVTCFVTKVNHIFSIKRADIN